MPADASKDGLFSRLVIRRSPRPDTLRSIKTLCESGDAVAVQSVTEVLSADPLASLSIMKRANHAYYGYRGRVESLTHAVELLSPDCAIKYVRELGEAAHTHPEELTDRLSEHARATGRIAHRIRHGSWLYERDDRSRPGIDFTAGLLHSVGRIILVTSFPDEAQSLYGDGRSSGMFVSGDWTMAERLQFGADHVEITEYVCRKLRLPDSLAGVLTVAGRPGHHPPGHPVSERAALIRLSAGLACAAGYGVTSSVSYLDILENAFWEPYRSAGIVDDSLIEQLRNELVPSGRFSGRRRAADADRRSDRPSRKRILGPLLRQEKPEPGTPSQID